MRQGAKDILGYIIHGASIPLFIYLVFTLDVPAGLRPLSYFGWALLGGGVGLVGFSLAALVRNHGAGLIQRGIYGVVRHPMYLGAMLCFLSYSFFHPHWLVLLVSLVNITVIYGFILQGDRQNLAKFGDAYQRYRETVPGINLPAGIIRWLRSK